MLFITLLVIKPKAQDTVKHYIGIKGGISIPNLTTRASVQIPLNTGYSSGIGPDFAVFYECLLSKKISLSTQLEYSAQGGKKNGFQALVLKGGLAPFFPPGQEPQYLYADFNSEAKINYLMLSELAKINFNLGKRSPVSVYIDAGPFAALLVSAHQVTSGSSIIYLDEQMQEPLPLNPPEQSFDNKQDIKDQLHKGNFGIEGDVGFALNMKHNKLFIEGGGNYGFLNIQKGTEYGKNNIKAGIVRVGYAYGF